MRTDFHISEGVINFKIYIDKKSIVVLYLVLTVSVMYRPTGPGGFGCNPRGCGCCLPPWFW